MRAIVLFSLVVLAACAHAPAPACDVTDISQVFASPNAYVGKRFCGEAYYFEGSELGGLYDQPVETLEQRLTTAILMTAGSGRYVGLREGEHQNVRVYATGTISDVCSDGPDGEVNCVPVRTAIFLSDWEVRRASQ